MSPTANTPGTPCSPSATSASPERVAALRARLLGLRNAAGHWEGRLSSSALSTATAVFALARVGGREDLVRRGVAWLEGDQHEDGGFGDAPGCPPNISTTTIAWAILRFLGADDPAARAEAWLQAKLGEVSAASISGAIRAKYGDDQTFSVPILTLCALAGQVAWEHVPALPFELAALPRRLFGWLGLPVVSYALPALIAIGQAGHFHRPSRNPLARLARGLTKRRTLRVLEGIQPESGGFLEATPLTSFVVMSLAGSGQREHPVVRRGVGFLEESVRDDGSWPIDTNLATWVSTLSIQALGGGALTEEERRKLRRWLLDQQYKTVHPYTLSAPGGWAWTDLSGGVPDADDTPGALLALRELGDDEEIRAAARAGVRWLCDLQNRDGGMPTFCRGWGRLPFDQSSPDLTAHALRAWRVWRELEPARVDRATARAVAYLLETQRPDGSWLPLWFGNPWAEGQANPVYGTARVLLCGELLPKEARERAEAWLREAPCTNLEERALAAHALQDPARLAELAATEDFTPAPIGLYFASLWYSEQMYPLVFTLAALRGA